MKPLFALLGVLAAVSVATWLWLRDPGPTDSLPGVKGRCLESDDGGPLAGCTVQVRTGAFDPDRWSPWPEGEVVAEVVTGNDGTFRLSFEAAEDSALAVRITAPDRVVRSGLWQPGTWGPPLDLGDVTMDAAVAVTGQVVDEEGAGMAGALVMLAQLRYSDVPVMDKRSFHQARADATGRFAMTDLVGPGEWSVAVREAGALVGPRTVTLVALMGPRVLEITVVRPDEADTITGTVQDTDGRPLGDIRLSAVGEGSMGEGRSKADGTFAVPRGSPSFNDGRPGVELRAADPDDRLEQEEPVPGQRVRWGDKHVSVILRPLDTRRVWVVDASGDPVTDFDLFHWYYLRGSREVFRIPSEVIPVREDEDGLAELHGLHAGRHDLLVRPWADDLAPQAVTFTIPGEEDEADLVVELSRRVSLGVQVEDAAGAGVAGARVDLVQVLGDEAFTGISEVTAIEALGSKGHETPEHLLRGTATTDASGAVELRVAPGTWWLRVRADGHVPHVEQLTVGSERAWTVVLEGGAALYGQVTPADLVEGLRHEAFAVLVRPAVQQTLAPAPVQDDGTWRMPSLPAGTYDVDLRYWLAANPVHAGAVTMPVGQVVLAAGDERRLDVDVSSLLPATVSGSLRVDGSLLPNNQFFLFRTSAGAHVNVRVESDAQGHFTTLVPPGEYSVRLALAAQPGPGWNMLPLPGRVVAEAGAETTHPIDAWHRRLRVRLRDAEGNPVVGATVTVQQTAYFRPGTLETDDEGWVELVPAPYGEFMLTAAAAGGALRFGPVVMPDGEREAERELRSLQ